RSELQFDFAKLPPRSEERPGMSIEINKKEKLLQLEQLANLSTYPSKRFNSFCYDDDDDEDYTIAVTPSLSTDEPDNSLSMRDEHLDTIPATESDEFIKSSVENLILIPSESKGIPDNTCDVPFHDNSPPLDVSKDQFEDFSDSNDKFSSPDDDSFSIDNIEYVEASPPDSELVSSDVMEIVIPEVGGIDVDILLTIKDDILREKLLNINLLIANIEALNDNPTSSSDFMTKSSSTSLNSFLEETNTFDNSLPEFETFYFDVEEISSGSTTTRSDISLPEYEAFYNDHVKEISSGSTTTHSDSSLYYSFIFDLPINPFPPANRSIFMSSPMNSFASYLHQTSVRDKLEVFRTNFFLGCDQDEKKMSWVKLKRCLASRKQGGLGIGSISGLNIFLLFKWIWRLLANPSDLWSRVIQKIYGLCGSIKEVSSRTSSHSTWGAILSSIKKLKQKGLDLISFYVRKIGNGESTSFWNDVWLGSMPLKSQFPRVYILDIDRNCFITNRVPLKDWSYVFRRHPRGGVEAFQFVALQYAIRNMVLSNQSDSWQGSPDI
nr:RNA-directed DNA polymerase, eukaryota, reverse transcriptase zinc-binding domain protein [Tanacetum cinerariifolium]